MRRYLGTFLCALSIVACSNNKPAVDASTSTTTAKTSEPPLTPAASYENQDATSSDTRTTTSPNKSVAPKSNPSGTSVKDGSSKADTGNGPPPVDTMPPARTDTSAADSRDPGPAPDNTKTNKRDGASNTPTPLDQKENRTDLNITQQIRKAVVGDSSLSFTAKNVKIITANGKVTLRGPVKSAEERAAIEAMAIRVAGAGNVDNQLEVAK